MHCGSYILFVCFLSFERYSINESRIDFHKVPQHSQEQQRLNSPYFKKSKRHTILSAKGSTFLEPTTAH